MVRKVLDIETGEEYDIGGKPLIEITYSQLVELRDNAQLVAGQQYRITDYETTTIQTDTRSAGHQFDIIVTALSENQLDENAKAIQHNGDTYFADSDLNAWELKYCLDNDTTRFAWACDGLQIYTDDSCWFKYIEEIEVRGEKYHAWENKENFNSDAYLLSKTLDLKLGDQLDYYDYIMDEFEEAYSSIQSSIEGLNYYIQKGKGVIYYMKDEFNNECPYDFKNIQFKRYRVSNEDSLVLDFDGLFYGLKDNIGTMITPEGYIADEEDYQWCYTFDWINEDYEAVDCSIEGNRTLLNDEGYIAGCYNNKFGIVTDYSVYNENPSSEFRILLGNNVIHCGNYNDDEFFYGINSNTIGNNFYFNTIGNNFNFNTIGSDFSRNTIGTYFYSNTIGNSFNSNTIGSDFNSNTIGTYFYSNTIGNNFYFNTIGNYFNFNTIGNYFNFNTIGSDFSRNTIGTYFYSNTIGNSFNNNTISNDVSYNTISNSFSSNTMYNYVKYINIENGVRYIELTSDTIGNSTHCLQNITIKSGVSGSSTTNRKVIEVERGLEKNTIIGETTTKLKLVAIGTCDTNYEEDLSVARFNLDKSLEKNKFYMIYYYEDIIGSFITTNLYVSNESLNIANIILTNADGEYNSGMIKYDNDNDSYIDLINLNSSNPEISKSELDYIKVYELPQELEI